MAALVPLASTESVLNMLQGQIGICYTPLLTFKYQNHFHKTSYISSQSFYANTSECVRLVWQA